MIANFGDSWKESAQARPPGAAQPSDVERRSNRPLIKTIESDMTKTPKPLLTIEYCTQCRWLLRAAWMAQEFLTTFEQELGGVTLVPGTGGLFEIRIEDRTLFSRKAEGGFPEIKILKQRIRDAIAPGRDLGHTDRP